MAVARGALHRDGRGSQLSGPWQLDVRVWCVRAESQHHGHTAMPTGSRSEVLAHLLLCGRVAMGLVQAAGQAEGAAVGRGGDISL